MARSSAYEPVLSSAAIRMLLALSRPDQRRMMTLLSRLAERPDQPRDYVTRSEDRELRHLRLANWRVSWPDNAVRELRVVAITKL